MTTNKNRSAPPQQKSWLRLYTIIVFFVTFPSYFLTNTAHVFTYLEMDARMLLV